ncbi:MAG: transcriptional regulator [Pseudomonadota bacterium]|nr:transcriptional regulator [Pseudomonadota bacterium]
MKLSLYSAHDVQIHLAEAVRQRRRVLRWSRQTLAERSLVPASTIKKFETTGQISLGQFLLLWQCVDDLARIDQLCQPVEIAPLSIDEVLKR